MEVSINHDLEYGCKPYEREELKSCGRGREWEKMS
jgi:hypothetical protein